MGLGGYLCWTSVAREIKKRNIDNLKLVPVEKYGESYRIIINEVFIDNEDFCFNPEEYQKSGGSITALVLNDPIANYCKRDTPQQAVHRTDRHIIEQYCERYGIIDPELKCYLKPDDSHAIDAILKKYELKDFITIEPFSNTEYTVNRKYPMSHWQKIVDVLNKKIKVVQVGVKNSPKLEGVLDLTGYTSFRNTAALIGKSMIFLSTEGGLVHAATAFDTKSVVIITGYQSPKMVSYPQNININIGKHGPCGLKIICNECERDSQSHDYQEIIKAVENHLCL